MTRSEKMSWALTLGLIVLMFCICWWGIPWLLGGMGETVGTRDMAWTRNVMTAICVVLYSLIAIPSQWSSQRRVRKAEARKKARADEAEMWIRRFGA